MRFHSTSDISQHLSLTPEGFLICKKVPLARTGMQIYYAGEVPVAPDQNGAITIHRSPEEVFHPDAIASFEGKPVTMHHPEGMVTPENWKELSIGHVQNVVQGTAIEADALYGDIVIMDPQAIDDIKERKIREVSCGYDADYIEDSPGKGRQMNIRGNHVALVEKGRCGSLCAIHDHKTEGGVMKGLWKKMVKSLTSDEQKELGIEFKDAELTTDQRLDRIEGSVASLVKMFKDAAEEEEKEEKKKAAADKRAADAEEEETEEEKKKKAAADKRAKDQEGEGEEEEKKKMSEDAAPIFQEVLYRASILAPDLSVPTMDAVKSMKKQTFDETCCLIKRKALDKAYVTKDGKDAISPFIGASRSVDFFTADCSTVDVAFIGASEIMKRSNQQYAKHTTSDFLRGGVTVASINEANKAFWDSRKGGK